MGPMRQVVLDRFGGPEVLSVSEGPAPSVPEDGYLVEVHAAGVNYADVVERRGRYAKGMRLPYALGKEAAGIVVARGAAATQFAVGERVIVIEMARNGCYAELVAAPEQHLLPARDGLDFEELAAYPIAFATAWYAIVETARARPGESILIHAAAGGVGVAAVQLAKALGLSPIVGTASSDAKCAWAIEHGADLCINYRGGGLEPNGFVPEVRDCTAGRGVDVVIDSVGGQVLEDSMSVTAPLGRVVAMGFASLEDNFADQMRRIHPLTLFHRSLTVSGLNLAALDFPSRRATWAALDRFVAEQRLRMPIGGRYALSEVQSAHRALEGRSTRGKLLLLP